MKPISSKKVKDKKILNPDWVPSRHTYKKLGSIIEHLTECINPTFYELKINFTQQPSVVIIRIYPIAMQPGIIVYPVWELCWTPYFNDKLYISLALVSPWAEW